MTSKQTDKYKDPDNIKILAEASKKIREFREKETSGDRNSYRVGVYTGINIVKRAKGEEPL
jgi:hypothetical protein